ncbi:MAG: hypothetical protein J6R31_04780, partial [Rikenellaceae bacterium]|nr:hypothetical protein [Rikenellaceae bacterium]
MKNGKWKISGNNTKDGFGNHPNPTLSTVSKPHDLKNAKCEGNFVPNEKAAPQFAFANEEPLIEVRCKIRP